MNNVEVTHFGVHYMLDGYGASLEILQSKPALKSLLKTLPERMGMHPICKPVIVEVGPNNKKDSGGISGFVMIAESHISFHTFPNRGFVTIDIYTCNDDLDANKLTQEFTNFFKLKDSEERIVKRATKYPLVNTQ